MTYYRKLTALSVLLAVVALLTVLAAGAKADWFPGDGHKMHYPQLPDPFGWDIKNGFDFDTGLTKVLADDWLCTQTGPVSDVHLWGSWKHDEGDPSLIQSIHLSIHDDVPAGDDPDPEVTWSHPGNLLWERDFSFTEISIIDPYGLGQQGWFNPNTDQFIENDHSRFHQINIAKIPDPYIQEEGTTYWLDVVVTLAIPDTSVEWGWKTSQNHWNDDAVWGDYNAAGDVTFWNELRDPITGESLDLAFVITIPEPATCMLLLIGLGAFLTTRRTAC